MKKNLEKDIKDLNRISDIFQDMEPYTDNSKEEKLLDDIATAIDNYRYFLQDLLRNMGKQNKPIDQGYEYMLGIREKVSHRM